MKIPGCPFTFISSTKADSEGLKKWASRGRTLDVNIFGFSLGWASFWRRTLLRTLLPHLSSTGLAANSGNTSRKETKLAAFTHPPLQCGLSPTSPLLCPAPSLAFAGLQVTTYIGFYGYHNKDHTPGGLKQQKFTPRYEVKVCDQGVSRAVPSKGPRGRVLPLASLFPLQKPQ